MPRNAGVDSVPTPGKKKTGRQGTCQGEKKKGISHGGVRILEVFLQGLSRKKRLPGGQESWRQVFVSMSLLEGDPRGDLGGKAKRDFAICVFCFFLCSW